MTENNNSEKIEITRELINLLKAEQRRTGKGPQAILRGTRNSRPKALNATLVKKWLSGQAHFAEKDHLTYIQNLWASFPDKKEVWLALTDRKRETFRKSLKETGLSINKLFSKRSDQPKGLEVKHISAYFMPSRQKINRAYYDYIIAVCEANKGKGYIALTPEIQQKLKAEIERTGFSLTAFMRWIKRHEDPRYSYAMLRGWLGGDVETLDKRLWDEVVKKYAALPDKVKVAKKKPAPSLVTKRLKPIAESDLNKMKQYRDMLGILPNRIFNEADDIPEGLNSYMISRWFSGATFNANPVHVEWVLARCQKLVEKAATIE